MKPIRNVLACLALLVCMSQAQAQFVQVYSPPIVPTVSYYAPPVYAPPVVNYSYYQPTVAYYPPAQVNYSYYQPTVAYSAPVVAYSAPAVAYPAPGYYTTQTYTGYGIFRPRGTYSQTYYTPYWR